MITSTVKPCKKHGDVIRDKRGYCKVCAKERHKRWVDKNPGKKNIYTKKWRCENIEKRNDHLKKWRCENAEKINKKLKEYRRINRYIDSEIKNLIVKCKLFKLSGLSRMDLPKELVELKRLQIKLHHAIKAREQQQTGETQ